MRVLIDECLPVKLKKFFPEFEVWTVNDKRWNGKKNGELLKLASVEFDVILTIDQSIPYQQNLLVYDIAIIAIKSKTNSLSDLQTLISTIDKCIQTCERGKIYRV